MGIAGEHKWRDGLLIIEGNVNNLFVLICQAVTGDQKGIFQSGNFQIHPGIDVAVKVGPD